MTYHVVDAAGLVRAFSDAVGKDRVPARVVATFQDVAEDVLLFCLRVEGNDLHDGEAERLLGLNKGRHLDVKHCEYLVDEWRDAFWGGEDGAFVACIDDGSACAVLFGYHPLHVLLRYGLRVDDLPSVFSSFCRHSNLALRSVDAHDAVELKALELRHEG